MPSHQQIVFILLIKEFSLSNNIYSKVKKVITVLTLIFIKKIQFAMPCQKFYA